MTRNLMTAFFMILFASACATTKKDAGAPPAKAPAPAVAAAAPAAKSAPGALSCKNDTDQRSAEIKTKGTGCEVAYTKFGKTSSVASAASGTQHCEEVLARMKKKLTASGFTCQ